MASGIIINRNAVPAPLFQPPASYGINRVPQRKALDPEKLLNLGLDLITRAQDQTSKACDLFRKLEKFACLNRDDLDDEDNVQILTELREDAEVLLERGLYSLDVALEILTRLRRPKAEFGEKVTGKSNKRWEACFHAMAGIYARVYQRVYENVIPAKTLGDLSHVPPKLHFGEPAKVARKRYDHRQSAAVCGGFPRIEEYWRERLVKGVEAKHLPGVVTTRRDTLNKEVSSWLVDDDMYLGPPDAESTPGKSFPWPSAEHGMSRKRKQDSNAPEPAAKKKKGDETPAPTSASNKRKQGAEADGAPAKKKQRGPTLRVTEGQELRSLTVTELAKLPWNKGKPAASEVEPRKYVYPPNGTPSQGLDFLADLKAWGEGDMSGAYLGFDGEDGEDGESPVHRAGPKGSGAEDKRDEVADDHMVVEGDGPPGGTVPGEVQDPDSEMPETPARPLPADDPDRSDTIATPTGLDDSQNKTPLPLLPTATPTIPGDSPAGPKTSPALPPPDKTPLSIDALPKHPDALQPMVTTPGCFTQFPRGQFSPEVPTSEFLEGWTSMQDLLDSSPSRRATPSKNSRNTSSLSIVDTPGGGSDSPAGYPSSSPRLPPPGGESDPAASTKASDSSSSGLFGSTALEKEGLKMVSLDETSQNQPSSENPQSGGNGKTDSSMISDATLAEGQLQGDDTVRRSVEAEFAEYKAMFVAKNIDTEGCNTVADLEALAEAHQTALVERLTRFDAPTPLTKATGEQKKTGTDKSSSTGSVNAKNDDKKGGSDEDKVMAILMGEAIAAGYEIDSNVSLAELRGIIKAHRQSVSDSEKARAASKTKKQEKENEGETGTKGGEDKGEEGQKEAKDNEAEQEVVGEDAVWLAKANKQPEYIGEKKDAGGEFFKVWEI